jgi:hypothetical protein
MPAVGTNALTMLDYLKQIGPDNEYAPYVDLMTQRNGFVSQIPWRQGALIDGDIVFMRTGLPNNGAAQWSTLNQGISGSKDTFTAVQFKAGQLTDKTEVDKRLATIAGEGGLQTLRARAAGAMVTKLTQNCAQVMIYESLTNGPERIQGLQTYYNTLLTANALSAANVVSGGGATANGQSSMYLLTKDLGFYGFIPKNSTMGLARDDRGEVEITDNAGSYTGYREYFYWNLGLAIPDWRQNVRICNIDTAALRGGSPADLVGLAEDAISKPTVDGMRFWIAPRNILLHLRKQARKSVGLGGGLTYENYQGQPILMLHGYPVIQEDQMLSTEAVVV